MNNTYPLRNLTNNTDLITYNRVIGRKVPQRKKQCANNYTDDDFKHLTEDKIKDIISELAKNGTKSKLTSLQAYSVDERLQIFLSLSNLNWTCLAQEQELEISKKLKKILKRENVVNIRFCKDNCFEIIQKIRELKTTHLTEDSTENIENSNNLNSNNSLLVEKSTQPEKTVKNENNLKILLKRFKNPSSENVRIPILPTLQEIMKSTEDEITQIRNDEQRHQELENSRYRLTIHDITDISEEDFLNVTTESSSHRNKIDIKDLLNDSIIEDKNLE